tara:strand:+ start:716 stop:1300 length:585 start_codon:yes stop_codon:yes gene_type:complete
MTHVIALLTDHLGTTAPKVVGHQYYVDATINFTLMGKASLTTTGNFTGVANNFIRTSGTAANFSTTLIPGQTLTISNAATGSNDGEVSVVSLESADALTLSAVAADGTGDEITLTCFNDVLSASEFGLSQINHIEFLSQENRLLKFTPRLTITGTSFTDGVVDNSLLIECTTLSTGAGFTGDAGMTRVRIYGRL